MLLVDEVEASALDKLSVGDVLELLRAVASIWSTLASVGDQGSPLSQPI